MQARWVRKFSAGVESIKNAPKSGRLVVQGWLKKIKEIVKSDTRYTSQKTADIVGISKASVVRILSNILKLKKKNARWVLYLFMDEQKHKHVKMALKLLKRFPRYNQKKASQ